MKNKPVGKVTVPAKAKGDGISSLFAEVRNLIQSARRSAGCWHHDKHSPRAST